MHENNLVKSNKLSGELRGAADLISVATRHPVIQ